MPAIPVTLKEKEKIQYFLIFQVTVKEKEKTSRTREPLDPRKVAPPKQVKYFCKKCNLDICNACFRFVKH